MNCLKSESGPDIEKIALRPFSVPNSMPLTYFPVVCIHSFWYRLQSLNWQDDNLREYDNYSFPASSVSFF